MKKTYIAPELNAFRLNSASMLCLSKGDDESNGIAESKNFWGSSIWEDEEEEEDDSSSF